MNAVVMILIGLFVVSFLVCLGFSTRSLIARIVASLMALGFALFCGFGFLASFELSDSASLPWKIGYGVLGVISLSTPVLLFVLAHIRGKSIELLK